MDDETLHGWKQVCAHLEISKPTAMKRSQYGVESRMPVFISRITGRIVAKRSELDRWKRDQIHPVGVEPVGFTRAASRFPRRHKKAKSKRISSR